MFIVNEPSAGAYYGSVVAAPYGKEILLNMFDYLNIPKDNEEIVKEHIGMPNLEGLSLTEATLKIQELGLVYELDGEGLFVAKQLPPAGTQVAVGDTILIVTD